MRKQTKSTSIPQSVKEAVYRRDNGVCVLCGSFMGEPVAHVVRRSQLGKGIEKNVVTLCRECHRAYDEGANIQKRFGVGMTRDRLYCRLVAHLKAFYPDWNREDMIYRKGGT